jgi:hypothetical protein
MEKCGDCCLLTLVSAKLLFVKIACVYYTIGKSRNDSEKKT